MNKGLVLIKIRTKIKTPLSNNKSNRTHNLMKGKIFVKLFWINKLVILNKLK